MIVMKVFAAILIIFLSFQGALSQKDTVITTSDHLVGVWKPLFRDCGAIDRTITISDRQLIIKHEDTFRFTYNVSDLLNQNGSFNLSLFDAQFSMDDGISSADLGLFGDDEIRMSLYHSYPDDILVLLPWKPDIYTPGEVTQPEAFVRIDRDEDIDFKPEIQSIFILPDGFTGFAWIAFEQPDGVVPETDSMSRRVIKVPESGFLLSQGEPMPVALARGEFAFVYNKNWGEGTAFAIPRIHEECRARLNSGVDIKDIESKIEYHLDHVFVMYCRYNNPGRSIINGFFGKQIVGQVFWFQVDTLSNLIK
jgi:hypothetical protein